MADQHPHLNDLLAEDFRDSLTKRLCESCEIPYTEEVDGSVTAHFLHDDGVTRDHPLAYPLPGPNATIEYKFSYPCRLLPIIPETHVTKT